MHVSGARRLRVLFGHVGDEGVGGEQEARDRGGVLERRADDLGGIDHAGSDEVLVGVGGGVGVSVGVGVGGVGDRSKVIS